MSIFVCFLIKKDVLNMPLWPSIFFCLYILFSIFSTIFFSVDKEESLYRLSFELVVFFYFIFFYNNQSFGKSFVKNVLLYLGVFLSFVSIYHYFFKLPVKTGFQLYANYYYGSDVHNRLGDFLGASFLFVYPSIFSIIFFIFILFSFSRSAYFATFFCIILCFWFFNKNKRTNKFNRLSIIVLLILIVFIFLVSSNFLQNSFFYELISNFIYIKPRSLFNYRLSLLQHLEIVLSDRLFWGVGLGNFFYSTVEYKTALDKVVFASSLWFEKLVEVGVFAFFFYTLFFLYVLLKSKKNKYFLVFLYFLVNFSTEILYKFDFLYLLIFVISGVVLNKNKVVFFRISSLFFVAFNVLIYFFISLFLLGKIFDIYWLAPFDSKIIKSKIQSNFYYRNDNSLNRMISLFLYIKSNIDGYKYIGDFFERNDHFKKAFIYREEALKRLAKNNVFDFDLFKKNYEFLKAKYNNRVAKSYFKTYYIMFPNEYLLINLCRKDLIVFGCRFEYYYDSVPYSLEKINSYLSFSKEYKLNADGLNESINYSIERKIGIYRIVVLGSSESFGIYVDQDKNWPAVLEKKLGGKYEVINLAYHGYDIGYSIDRFYKKGVKYNPDLILFFLPSPVQYNDILFPIVYSTDEYLKRTGLWENMFSNNNPYPSWSFGWKKMIEKYDEYMPKQKQIIKEFFEDFSDKKIVVIFFSDQLNKYKDFMNFLLENHTDFLLVDKSKFNKNDFYPEGNLTTEGQLKIADEVYNFLFESVFN